MSIPKTRKALYATAKLLGDVQAVQQRKVAKRVQRRVYGRVAGRLLGWLTR